MIVNLLSEKDVEGPWNIKMSKLVFLSFFIASSFKSIVGHENKLKQDQNNSDIKAGQLHNSQMDLEDLKILEKSKIDIENPHLRWGFYLFNLEMIWSRDCPEILTTENIEFWQKSFPIEFVFQNVNDIFVRCNISKRKNNVFGLSSTKLEPFWTI